MQPGREFRGSFIRPARPINANENILCEVLRYGLIADQARQFVDEVLSIPGNEKGEAFGIIGLNAKHQLSIGINIGWVCIQSARRIHSAMREASSTPLRPLISLLGLANGTAKQLAFSRHYLSACAARCGKLPPRPRRRRTSPVVTLCNGSACPGS